MSPQHSPHFGREDLSDDDTTRSSMAENENKSPSSSATATRNSDLETAKQKSRILYCRKCEGHGEKVILKNHSPQCPYILCSCKSCEKLNCKRLKSFNKRNKEKIELAAALNAKRHAVATMESTSSTSADDDEGTSRRSSFSSKTSSPGMEDSNTSSSVSPNGLPHGRSMSLGAMTVMSYDIWKAKCASEKKRRQQEQELEQEQERVKKLSSSSLGDPSDPSTSPKRTTPSPTPIRKRAHTFVAYPISARTEDIPVVAPKKMSVDEKKGGKYILLPTIPAMRIFVNEDDEKPAAPPPSKVTPTTLMSPPPAPSQPPPPQIAKPSPLHPMAFKPLTTSPVGPPPMSHPSPIVANMSTEQIISSLTLHNTVLQQQQANSHVMHELLANLNGGGGGATPSTPSAPSAELLSMLRLQQQAAALAAALQAAGVQLPPTTTTNVTIGTTTPNMVPTAPPPMMPLVTATPNILSSLLPMYSNPV